MIQNDYRIAYLEIIEHAKSENRTKSQGYYEDHHIIPKSLGGSNEIYNMVLLTPEEHFKVHVLLPYFTEGLGRDKMIYAWNMMSNINGVPIDYKEYTNLKETYSKVHSEQVTGRKHSKETKRKMSESQKGRITSEETKKKMSEANKGKPKSKETKKKMSKAQKGRKHPEESKKKIGDAQRGISKSEEHKNKISESIKNKPRVACPYCNKTGAVSQMKRWHFANCNDKI